ncbi:MAG: ATP-binding protein, partial [Flavobacteriales bacterium]|nr:ATP-binding protein [Flavobacteriales bacterium]
MAQGNINVQAENIFPIIKQFLYSDQEIFLRELVSNAVDACQKLKTLSKTEEFDGELADLKVQVKINETDQTITISDNGIGMTGPEIEKYIAQIAFSGAEEFVQKYQDKAQGIIGHFGLGFFSAFMVSDKVEVVSKSYKGENGSKWVCEGNPTFDLSEFDKENRGTDIILHVSEDAKEFLSKSKISELLNKYCKFLPIPVEFVKAKKEDGEDKNEQINNTEPAWTKKPSELKDEDYSSFYRELYPMTFEESLFN